MMHANHARNKSIQPNICFYSVYAVSFWNEFRAWWQDTRENISLEDSTLLYGLVKPQKHQKALNLALLAAKSSSNVT